MSHVIQENKDNADRFLNFCHGICNVKNDSKLSEKLGMNRSDIGVMRMGQRVVGAMIVLRVHLLTGHPVRDLLEKAGLLDKVIKVKE